MTRPLLVVLEGANDIEFLSRISRRLSDQVPAAAKLIRLAEAGRIAFIPLGGGDPASWPTRFQPLNLPEFHLYDREQLPETNVRQRAADRVNARSGCFAALTSKRSLENYLHPWAVLAAGGGELTFGDHDCVSLLVAQRRLSHSAPHIAWQSLTRRMQARLIGRAKRWLNQVAVEQMTAELLAERDPVGELAGWLSIISKLAAAAG
jgi:hypothetical protein